MASFVVMEPPADRAGEERMVRDGFSWLAFLLPFLWLLWHRLWLEGLVAIALMMGFSVLSTLDGWGPVATGLSLALSIVVGLEGPAIRIAALRRRGWREWGVVEADSRGDAELRYLFATESRAAAMPRSVPVVAAAPRAGSSAPPLGLLGYSPGT